MLLNRAILDNDMAKYFDCLLEVMHVLRHVIRLEGGHKPLKEVLLLFAYLRPQGLVLWSRLSALSRLSLLN